MSNLIHENNTLTTDAVPDAPRTNIQENKEPESEQNEFKECSAETNETEKKTSSGIPSYSTKPKKRAPCAPPPHKPTHANTKVINIVNSKGVHVGPIHNYNLYSSIAKKNSDHTKQNILRTTEVDQFLSKQELVQREDIDYVSTHLGLKWRDVGIRLGYSDGQLDHFYEDNKNIGVKEVVYQMLLDWTRMYPGNSKIGILSTALWDADQKEVVCRWMKKM